MKGPSLGRPVQFGAIYLVGLGLLYAAKYGLGMSDYLVPSPRSLIDYSAAHWWGQMTAMADTMAVAVAGHATAVASALIIAAVARGHGVAGNLTRMTAYNLQAYPVVALAPIIFLFLGDGFPARLLIAVLIAYFPLLLSFIGIFSSPVEEVEHFFRMTGRLSTSMELTIRLLENPKKVITVVSGTGTLSMVGAIVAEFIATSHGIGYLIRKALYQDNLAAILLALFIIGLFSSLYVVVIEEGGRWLLEPGRRGGR